MTSEPSEIVICHGDGAGREIAVSFETRDGVTMTILRKGDVRLHLFDDDLQAVQIAREAWDDAEARN
jgi:hypothetical protein